MKVFNQTVNEIETKQFSNQNSLYTKYLNIVILNEMLLTCLLANYLEIHVILSQIHSYCQHPREYGVISVLIGELLKLLYNASLISHFNM